MSADRRNTNAPVVSACNSEPVRVSLAPSRADASAGRIAALAQPVEHVIRNDGVVCSSHTSGTTPTFLNYAMATMAHRVERLL